MYDDDANLKIKHMNKEKRGKCKRTSFILLGVFLPQSSGFGSLAGDSPSLVLSTRTVPCLRWLCDGACFPLIAWEGIAVWTNGRISFFGQKGGSLSWKLKRAFLHKQGVDTKGITSHSCRGLPHKEGRVLHWMQRSPHLLAFAIKGSKIWVYIVRGTFNKDHILCLIKSDFKQFWHFCINTKLNFLLTIKVVLLM